MPLLWPGGPSSGQGPWICQAAPAPPPSELTQVCAVAPVKHLPPWTAVLWLHTFPTRWKAPKAWGHCSFTPATSGPGTAWETERVRERCLLNECTGGQERRGREGRERGGGEEKERRKGRSSEGLAGEHGHSCILAQLALLSPECLLSLRGIQWESGKEKNALQSQMIKWSRPRDPSAIEVDVKWWSSPNEWTGVEWIYEWMCLAQGKRGYLNAVLSKRKSEICWTRYKNETYLGLERKLHKSSQQLLIFMCQGSSWYTLQKAVCLWKYLTKIRWKCAFLWFVGFWKAYGPLSLAGVITPI